MEMVALKGVGIMSLAMPLVVIGHKTLSLNSTWFNAAVSQRKEQTIQFKKTHLLAGSKRSQQSLAALNIKRAIRAAL